MKRFPHFLQTEQKDCGPTCIKIVAKYFGKELSIHYIRQLAQTNRIGSSLKALAYSFEQLGIRTLAIKISVDELADDIPLPCVVFWRSKHYVILYKIHKGKYYVSDPACGLLVYTKSEFEHAISVTNDSKDIKGYFLLLDKTSKFDEQEDQTNDIVSNSPIKFALKYFFGFGYFFKQLSFGVIILSVINLLFPFLNQALVDKGIGSLNLHFVYLILFAQLFLFFGKSAIEVIRAYLVLHVSKRVNIRILAEFFSKLMRLPISFFDTKMIGDLLVRMDDHSKIERFLSNTIVETMLSAVNLLVFGFVLATYNLMIFSVFFGMTALYVLWVIFFLKKRKILEYKLKDDNSSNQSKVLELLNGMQEIKINNAEFPKRWEWEKIQSKLFRVNLNLHKIEQIQTVGSQFINELKNIIISILSATLVINGEISIGIMLSISFMVGQLNLPITQFINFAKSFQDAKIAVTRINEIYALQDEDANLKTSVDFDLKEQIAIKDLTFRFDLTSNRFLFKELNLTIPANKTTAIVGLSGSGKTTLLRLLLKFYEGEKGSIYFDHSAVKNIPASQIRDLSGVVMQEGVIFPNTVLHNITIGTEDFDQENLKQAIKIANLEDLIKNLPKGIDTEIGKAGINLSTGQKQRILIARAVYKNPKLLLFDEATSALDSENEKIIMENLYSFFRNRTVVVVAHRLSTVKNADKIVVLNNGKIVEEGNHQELIARKGAYFQLVKNQLEIGN